ncbi:hypothetical protein EAF00_003648 [Botryotinia globosa]|nr:hypothetical protein EAF00_003648 [Botryotinia globosa]
MHKPNQWKGPLVVLTLHTALPGVLAAVSNLPWRRLNPRIPRIPESQNPSSKSQHIDRNIENLGLGKDMMRGRDIRLTSGLESDNVISSCATDSNDRDNPVPCR